MKLPVIATCVLLAGCASSPSTEESVKLANPASTYCVEQGGKVEIRTEEKGQTGYCHLPDGRVIEEWTFFRAKKD